MALLDNRDPDRADMGGGADVHERWGSGMTEIKNKRHMRFDACWANDDQTLVTIDVGIDPFGLIQIEMSNIIGCCNDDKMFEEAALMSPDQFKVFAAALKALADTL